MKGTMKVEALIHHPIFDVLAWTLIHSLWQGAAIAIVIALLLGFFASASPGLRYNITALGLGLIPIFAFATFIYLIQPTETELIPRTAFAETSDLTEAEAFFTLGHLQSPNPEQAVDEIVPQKFRITVVLLWMSGTLFFALRLVAGFTGVFRMTRIGVSAPDAALQEMFDDLLNRANYSRNIKLIVSSVIDVPTTVGWMRPCILIPASIVSGFPPVAIEAFIAHELMHVQRYDYLVNLLQHVVEALFFYHPATWWLSRKIRNEREYCCDDQAVRLLGGKLDYVKALAGLAEKRHLASLAPAANGSSVLFRIQRMLGSSPASQSTASSGPAGLVIATILVGVITLVAPMVLEASERIIPRSALFQPNTRTAVKVSPDANWISFRGAWQGTSNLWVSPRDNIGAARPLTSFKGRGIRSAFWSYSKDLILFMHDRQGEENWKLSTANARTGEVRTLIDIAGVQARVRRTSSDVPDEIVISMNDRDPRYHDLYRLNLLTGERKLLIRTDERFKYFVVDDWFNIRFAMTDGPDGNYRYLSRDDTGNWQHFMDIGADDYATTWIGGFDKSGRTIYMSDSRNRDTAAITSLHLDTGEYKVLLEHPRADAMRIFRHPTEKHFIGTAFHDKKWKWHAADKDFAKDVEYLDSVNDGSLGIHNKSLDNQWWLVSYVSGHRTQQWYLYNRKQQQAQFLFSRQEPLETYGLAKLHPVVIKARDGLDLISYLTLPDQADTNGDGRPDKPLPMVLDVHGGPSCSMCSHRWRLNYNHQWLANRGYAVLSINFRGTMGYGKAFVRASIGEWGGKMHDDLIDGVDWAIREGIAIPDKVAIMGSSYGGYATLVGMAMTPGRFACGVDVVGISNLVTDVNSVPAYWKPHLKWWKRQLGGSPDEEVGREFLRQRSPLTFAHQIQGSLLIAHGANDVRVKQSESDQIVDAMLANRSPVTYLQYPDEGHRINRTANRLSLRAVTEVFLAQCLGGRHEPIQTALQGSSLIVPVGAERIPGLVDALESNHNYSAIELN
jgi:dipeptidyl aminopeptidase/acylaminoacyl peptidase/beta-lactamase regulating signal transducer with metallopeptidase domain